MMLLKVTLKILLNKFIILLLLFSFTISANEYQENINSVQKLFYEWHPEETKELLNKIEKVDDTNISYLFLKAKYYYLIGDYQKSNELINYIKLNHDEKTYSQVKDSIEIMENAYKEISQYVEFKSKDGKYVVKTPKGKDEVLGEYALDVLEKSYKTHTTDLEYKDDSIIRLEILPDVETLDKLSGLTLKEIQTSGTIALCDDNKLMITSPKSLIKGYEWLDTISHELVHMVISKKTRNRTPIWIHEGIAKFQESRWKLKPGLVLDKYSENILATAHQKKHYISFEAMSPSLAKLPSQEDASLAYAQVATLMDWAYSKWGYEIINKLLDNITKYNNDKKAVLQTFGFDINKLLEEWKKHVSQKGYKTYQGLMDKPILFKTADSQEDYKFAEVDLFKNRDMKKWIRLGNMLYEVNRYKAAQVEYEKAIKYKKNEYPYLENKLASLYIINKEYQKAINILTPTLSMFTNYIDSYMNLGEAYFNLKDYNNAKLMYETAIEINPFLKDIYIRLIDIYDNLKLPLLKTRAENCSNKL